MRVIIDGTSINEIVVNTFLSGLYETYKEKLYIIYRGGNNAISKITEAWVDNTWKASASRNSWNAEWLDKFEDDLISDFNDKILLEGKPDLVFSFGAHSKKTKSLMEKATEKNIPVFYVEKVQ